MTTHMKHAALWAIIGCMVLSSIPALAADEADGLGPYADVDGSVHELDVAALWASEVTDGCDEWLYCPDDPVSRGELAAFLVRALDLPPGSGDHGFTDVAGAAFEAEIAALADSGLTGGCGPNRFCPEAGVTRGEMATFLARGLDLSPRDAGFADVSSTVHEGNIGAIAEEGIALGCDDDRFCPRDPVTRAQMASFLVRALELQPPQQLPSIPQAVLEELGEPEWPDGPGAEGWRGLIEEHFRAQDVDRAVRIVACESNGDPGARNRSSGASGLFQHMPRYWPERSAAAGFSGASIYDPVANVAVAAWLVYDYPGGGWQHWVCKG